MTRDAVRIIDGQHWFAAFEAYSGPSFVEDMLGAVRLADLLSGPGTVGVARLIREPSFCPESIVTVVYRCRTVEVEVIEAASSLWLATTEQARSNAPVFGGIVKVRNFRVSLRRLPLRPFQSWAQLLEATHLAPDRDLGGLDGETFFQKLLAPNLDIERSWWSPRAEDAPAQAKLVRVWQQITWLAELRRVWRC